MVGDETISSTEVKGVVTTLSRFIVTHDTTEIGDESLDDFVYAV
jgi:hypothetical protein